MTIQRTSRRLGTCTLSAAAVCAAWLVAACSSDTGISSPDGGAPDAPADRGSTTDGGSNDVSPETGAPDGGGPNGHVVISQIFGGGGSADAPFTNDYVELFNAHRESISLRGWSLQYASSAGTGLFGANDGQLTELPDVTLEPGQYYLVQLAEGTADAGPLPTADFVDPTPINMSATAGKMALVKNAMPLGCNGGATPCTAAMLEAVVDLVGYGGANYFEGSGPAAAISTTTAAFRAFGGCWDTDDNAADFATAAPAPRHAASPRNDCRNVDAGRPNRDAGNDSTQSDAPPADALSGKRIRDIQGRTHISPLAGSVVSAVAGIVTVVGTTGFYFQDPTPDADDATSEGLFVYTASAPTVIAGDSVLVSGTVDEFRSGCTSGCTASSSAYSNLTTTELKLVTVTVVSSGNALPLPIAIGAGAGARRPPTNVIEDDTTGSVEIDAKSFDPASDGIDFYESLEGMWITVTDAVAVGPTTAFTSGSREIPIVPGGIGAGLRTARGGIVVAAGDFNPERIILSNALIASSPDVNVGDKFLGAITGVVDYAFAKYNLLNVSALPPVVSGGIAKETLDLPERGVADLDIASFNVENLDPTDPADKFARLAGIVVTNLKSPDLIAVEEIQDNNGATSDGTVDASTTFTMLASAIVTAGGPSYQFRAINPEDGKDGGEAGGNIRIGYLYRTDRGLSFVDRPGAVFNTPNDVVTTSGKAALAYSPGRIDPTN
ncbi:MAG: lamin tail domain-containing protein, partial [Polyangiaceae bacterium]